MHPSMCTIGMSKEAAAIAPVTVFVSPKKTTATGCASESVRPNCWISDPIMAWSLLVSNCSVMSGSGTSSCLKKMSFMLSE